MTKGEVAVELVSAHQTVVGTTLGGPFGDAYLGSQSTCELLYTFSKRGRPAPQGSDAA